MIPVRLFGERLEAQRVRVEFPEAKDHSGSTVACTFRAALRIARRGERPIFFLDVNHPKHGPIPIEVWPDSRRGEFFSKG